MLFSNPNRTLLQGILVCGVVLASATACSRADRVETGLAETLQADSAAGYRAMERDTASAPRIRPPEDSTELRGDGTSYETADEQVIDAGGTER